jgi:hypothetical protein
MHRNTGAAKADAAVAEVRVEFGAGLDRLVAAGL